MLSITPLLVFASVYIAIAILLTCAATRPNVRTSKSVQRAIQAMGVRDFDKALKFYDGADRLLPKIPNEIESNAFRFAIEQGRGICCLSKNQFEMAETHLVRAAGLLEGGVEEKQRIVVSLHSSLATAQFCQSKSAEGDASLAEVEKLCDAAIDGEIEEVAEILVGAAAGASSRNLYAPAFRLARLAVAMLSKTDAWHAG